MVVKLFGPRGDHFGWMLEGDIFDVAYQPLAFPDGDDLYSFSGNWLGTYDRCSVYDRNGGVVATAWGHRPIRIAPSRFGRIPPRIKPVPSPLPREMRAKDTEGTTEGSLNSARWAGLSMDEWLEQPDN